MEGGKAPVSLHPAFPAVVALWFAALLGLGTLLVDHPDEANDPALSARLLCANISNHVSRMREALDRGDIAAARKMTNGGTHGVEAFVAAYQAMIAIL